MQHGAIPAIETLPGMERGAMQEPPLRRCPRLVLCLIKLVMLLPPVTSRSLISDPLLPLDPLPPPQNPPLLYPLPQLPVATAAVATEASPYLRLNPAHKDPNGSNLASGLGEFEIPSLKYLLLPGIRDRSICYTVMVGLGPPGTTPT